MVTKQRLLQFMTLAHRKPVRLENEFHSYWNNEAYPLIQDWLAPHGTLGYTQVGWMLILPAHAGYRNHHYRTPFSERDQAKSDRNEDMSTIEL